MLQSKLISDTVNYHRYGLEYALNQIREDCTCQKCKTKYSNSLDVKKCCRGESMELEEKRMKKERNVTVNDVVDSIESEYLDGIIVVTMDKDGTIDTGYSLDNNLEGMAMLDIAKDELKEWLGE